MHKIEDFIIVIKQIIPTSLCDEIINEYKNDTWQLAITRGGEMEESRNCSIIPMSSQNTDTRKKLDFEIFQSAAKCIKIYNDKFKYSTIDEDTGYDLLKYETGQYYREHVDSFIQQPRLISCSFALNDDFDGGEFGFFENSLKYTLSKGDAIMFPSNFMYPHEVNTVTKGTRYSIITWFR